LPPARPHHRLSDEALDLIAVGEVGLHRLAADLGSQGCKCIDTSPAQHLLCTALGECPGDRLAEAAGCAGE
jgi:hypothetical protein